MFTSVATIRVRLTNSSVFSYSKDTDSAASAAQLRHLDVDFADDARVGVT